LIFPFRSAVVTAAALLSTAALAGPAAATGPASGAPLPSPDQITKTVQEVVALQLLQPTCGEPGALNVATVEALKTIKVPVDVKGVEKIDLGELGWIGIGTQYPGKAVGVEVHLTPVKGTPVDLTIGARACPQKPAPSSSAPAVKPGSPAPSKAAVVPSAQPVAARPSAVVAPQLARTGAGDGDGQLPYLVAGAVLLCGGAAVTAVAARRRRAAARP
jgi:hypothetical protein